MGASWESEIASNAADAIAAAARARALSPFRFGGLFEGGRSRENAAEQLVH